MFQDFLNEQEVHENAACECVRAVVDGSCKTS